MKKEAAIVLIGLSNYGTGYARLLIEQGPNHHARLAGVVDPYAKKNPYWTTVAENKIACYDTLPEFLANQQADLAIIASPIHLHCPQTCAALQAGLPVLCEKPIAGTIQEVQRMIAAREKAGKFVAIGYNWSFSEEIQALKRDVMAGLFGRAIQLKTTVLWPRTLSYYNRNNWAGKQQTASGDWILDSPVNNATAHYLHNMFYILGAAIDQSAMPLEVVAELYRANKIENYDTGCLRARTDNGATVLYITSHAVEKALPITFEFVFEQAAIKYQAGADIQATFQNGKTKKYATPAYDQQFNKLWQCIESLQTGNGPVCGLEAAMAQTLCMNGAQDSTAIVPLPPAMLRHQVNEKGDDLVVASGLTETLQKCYDAWQLPSEQGATWSQAGRRVGLRNYTWFPGGQQQQ